MMQYVVNGLIAGCSYALLALGIGFVLRVFRFFNLAHGTVFVVGAYATYSFSELLYMPLWLSILLSITLATSVGTLLGWLFCQPSLKTKKTSLVLLLVSLGVLIATQGIIALLFGAETRQLSRALPDFGLNILGAISTRTQVAILVVTMAVFSICGVWFRWSGKGKQIRALGSDPELASCVGIDIARSSVLTYTIAAAVTGIAAVLFTLDIGFFPTMGFNSLLMAIVATVIGGNSGLTGSLVGGLLIGLVQQLSVSWFPAQWQDAVVFSLLIVVLVVRPYGLLGTPPSGQHI